MWSSAAVIGSNDSSHGPRVCAVGRVRPVTRVRTVGAKYRNSEKCVSSGCVGRFLPCPAEGTRRRVPRNDPPFFSFLFWGESRKTGYERWACARGDRRRGGRVTLPAEHAADGRGGRTVRATPQVTPCASSQRPQSATLRQGDIAVVRRCGGSATPCAPCRADERQAPVSAWALRRRPRTADPHWIVVRRALVPTRSTGCSFENTQRSLFLFLFEKASGDARGSTLLGLGSDGHSDAALRS